jgi:succinoglycan biosynthesis transport protein ExoP
MARMHHRDAKSGEPTHDMDEFWVDNQAGARGGREHGWHDYLLALRRRFWPAAGVFVAVVVAGVIYGFTKVPVYEAKVRLLIDRDRSDLTGLGTPFVQESEQDFQTQLTILRSRSLVRRTMGALGTVRRTAPRSPSGSAAPAAEAAGNAPTDTAAIDAFLASVRVSQVPESRLVDVFVAHTEPAMAAKSANTLVEEYIKQSLEYRTNTSKNVTDWLTDRRVDQRTTLEASEKALQAYRDKHAAVATNDGTAILVEKLGNLVGAYTKAKTERIEKGALYVQVQDLERDPASVESLPAVLSNPYVQKLKADLTARKKEETELGETLGARHPSMLKAREAVRAAQALLDGEVAKIVESIRRDYVAAQEAEATLNQALEAQKRESLALNRSDVELAILQRDAESNRQIYESLNQRLNEFAVTRQQRSSNISIVDPAEVPQRPISGSIWTDLRYAVLGGLALALGLAFWLEFFDNCVKTPGQIKSLGVAMLGLIPRLEDSVAARPGGPGQAERDATPDPVPDQVPRNGDEGAARALPGYHTPAVFDEAFRVLRTNVRLSTVKAGARTILVTSPGSGDGKSLVASCLAVTLAQGKHHVILVDADLRRPTLHTRFDVPQGPGLSELLTGQLSTDDARRHSRFEHLDLLSSGAHPPNPSELLDAQPFKDLLVQLEQEYDWVIIDSPPVMPVTDAIIIAASGADVIIVASAEATPLPALRGALEQLGRTGTRVLGAVLNRADLRRRGYYYSDYYHRDYTRYYTSTAVS